MTSPDSHKTGSMSKVEADLVAALDRLKLKKKNGRPVRISYSAVAEEAGKSRTLIGHQNCPYPEVRNAIGKAIREQRAKEAKAGQPIFLGGSRCMENSLDLPLSTPAIADPMHTIARLRQQVEFLTKQIKVAAIKIVAIDDENQQLRAKIAELMGKAERGISPAKTPPHQSPK